MMHYLNHIVSKQKGSSIMNKYRLLSAVLFITFSIISNQRSLNAQMLDPAIDRNDEPFCYYSRPTDVIGVMDGRWGTLVSPEGYLYTGFGELMFFTGNPPEPVHQRVKTLYKGYLPVIEYKFERDGVMYQFTMFAATLDGKPESPLMNFIRVSLKNEGKVQRTAHLGVGVRYQNESNTLWGTGDNRFTRPRKSKYPGGYDQAGVEFSKDWVYGFSGDAFLRDGKVFYLFPPAPEEMMTLKTGYNDVHDLTARKLGVLPTTPVGIALYHCTLKPNQEKVLDFKMPYEPLQADTSPVARLRDAKFDDYFDRTVDFWENIFKRGIEISLPEEKVVNTFKSNLVYDLIARNKVDSFYVQTVNDFHYHAFWLRDGSYIIRMYDLSGYHDIARQCLDFFPRWQKDDGNYVSQGGQFDGWGQAMWAYGQHYRITHDKAFAENVFPSIQKAVAWLHKARQDDPLHIMPATSPGDNEDITGHVTGHNFWALAGLKNIIALAEGIGRSDDATTFQKEYDDYRATLVDVLHKVTAKTGGYMPPGLDSLGGQDWGNMLSVYPEITLDPHDTMVTATLNMTRAKYKEGIMTYGDGRWLHHYLTMKNTETEVVRGDQQMAMEELYAMLVHTSATHAGFEFCILPWSTRDFEMNLTPHGWFAAKFRALLRNMLVREQGKELHVFSCISPEWIKDGATIAVRRAPTNFGQVNAELKCTQGMAFLTFKNEFTDAPEAIVLHLPWFVRVSLIHADGKAVAGKGPAVTLPAGTKRVQIEWTMKPESPPLSYTIAVENYKKEYRKRYEEFLKTGK